MLHTTDETDVRAFAAEFDTTNVREMVRLAETGRITWAQAAGIARRSLAKSLAVVPTYHNGPITNGGFGE